MAWPWNWYRGYWTLALMMDTGHWPWNWYRGYWTLALMMDTGHWPWNWYRGSKPLFLCFGIWHGPGIGTEALSLFFYVLEYGMALELVQRL